MRQNSDLYLVDTNVISANSPNRKAHARVADWMDRHSDRLYLSAVTIAEIEDGIAKLRREGARQKAGNLAAWIETLLHLYRDRVLAFDVDVARVAGALSDKARGLGVAPGFADIAIAATASHHSLTLLTRNTRDFTPLGIGLLDPFEELPG